MNVVVTGNLGYVGAVLTRRLREGGYHVTGYDTGYFAESKPANSEGADRQVVKDVREIEARDLDGADAVVHLAALSNDPLGKLDPELTDTINHRGTLRVAEAAKQAGVRRFVYASSCSMYGVGTSDTLNEEAPFRPQTAYAISKVKAEEGLRALADGSFSPVFLRQATIYGVSPSMRFDLVLNNLIGWAVTTGKVRVMSDGAPWRPLVHLEDACSAYIAVLEAPREAVHNQAFNVGQSAENYQIRDIAEVVPGVVPDSRVQYANEVQSDSRTYKVDFSKISERLSGFKAQWNIRRGAEQLYRWCKEQRLDLEGFQSRSYTRLAQVQHLLDTGRVDANLLWKRDGRS